MEDTTHLSGTQGATSNSKTDESKTEKRAVRRSDAQEKIDQSEVLTKVLKTPITMDLGEVFGISRELSGRLLDLLKPKKSAAMSTSAETKAEGRTTVKSPQEMEAKVYYNLPNTGKLIRVRMFSDGLPMTAIIDTGSMLNIASKAICRNAIVQPVDTIQSVHVQDVNGGSAKLTGYIPDVPLRIGRVVTHANVYVSEDAPFELLLGRPWQRGNLVSIDEREDGTYLVFRDEEMNQRYELLVISDKRHTIESHGGTGFSGRALTSRGRPLPRVVATEVAPLVVPATS